MSDPLTYLYNYVPGRGETVRAAAERAMSERAKLRAEHAEMAALLERLVGDGIDFTTVEELRDAERDIKAASAGARALLARIQGEAP